MKPLTIPHQPIREQAIQLAFSYLSDKQYEHQIIIYPNNHTLELMDITNSQSSNHVDYSLEMLLENKYKFIGKSVFIAHNHPSNCLEPSMGDYIASKEFNSLLRLNQTHLEEEFIVTQNGICSFVTPPLQSKLFFIENPLNDRDLFSEKEHFFQNIQLEKEESNHIELRKQLIYREILKGNEVAVSSKDLFISNSFSFEELLKITSNFKSVVVWGFPEFKSRKSWERIIDIDNVFGSIEIYSLNKHKDYIPLKKEMIL